VILPGEVVRQTRMTTKSETEELTPAPGSAAPSLVLVPVDLPNAPPVRRVVSASVGHPDGQATRPSLWESSLGVQDLPLVTIELPPAPSIKRMAASSVSRPKLPAIALLVLGIVLVVGPIAGGLFAKAAGGQQMIEQFAPYMEAHSLSRYRADLQTLQHGTSGIDAVYSQQRIAAGRFPLLDDFRSQSTSIVGRASRLLRLVGATQPDYVRVSRIGGFDRMPFLIVVGGMVMFCGGCVMLVGGNRRARTAAVLVLLSSAAVAAYPFAAGLYAGASAGNRMLHSLAPMMTAGEVRQLQSDFVVVVEAVGELETSFRGVAKPGIAATQVATLVDKWPMVSSDLACLVGVIENNLSNFDALENLDALTRGVGVPGLVAFPWFLLSAGTVSAGLAYAAWPRNQKETI
jgi:hypothetical protein